MQQATTEQKLTMLKTINIEKELIDADIDKVSNFESRPMGTIVFVNPLGPDERISIDVDPAFSRHCLQLVKQELQRRKTELIDRANRIMKS